MPAVIIQQPLAPEEISQLKEEFPDYDYLLSTPDDWSEVEVLYGSNLKINDLKEAHRLRWIHAPSSNLHGLPLQQIHETTNLLVSNTKDPDVHCFAEYAIGAILASSKNLLEWSSSNNEIWESPYRDILWSIKGKTLLQIGLGHIGTAILEKAEQFGMRTWGVDEKGSFHDHCEKTFELHELHSLLPAVDVLSIAIPRGETSPCWIKETEFKLMKSDSIILAIGSFKAIDQHALAKEAETGKFRSVILDIERDQIDPQSSLWKNALITPSIAGLPTDGRRLEFVQFQYNFRRYARNEFEGMKNLVGGSAS